MENQTLNKALIRGRVGQEPRQFNAGDSIGIRFSVATSETYHDRSGNIKEEVNWINICAWEGRNINNLKDIRKGMMVCVEGRIRNTRYMGSDGSERYTSEIVANKLELVRN